jgi:F0F1-type ATP synthase delta subunit
MIQSKKLALYAFSLFQKGFSVEKITQAVKDVLIAYKQESLYTSFLKNFKKLLERQNEFETFFIESPYPLHPETQARVIKAITNDPNPSVVYKENKDLLLGFRASYRGQVFDASAKKYITNLKKLSR